MNNINHNAHIELMMTELNSQIASNVNSVVKKYSLVESTLRRWFKGETASVQTQSSEYKQWLTLTQKKALIEQINHLTDRELLSISQMIRNLAEKMLEGAVSKNWTGQFCQWYKNQLKSLYLHNIDSKRMKAEYLPIFKQFYDLIYSINSNNQ